MEKKQYSPKEVAIFEGVLQLQKEKSLLSSVTVSQIAKAAGIGKGTVYEYFDSKEDIIVQTVFYSMAKERKRLRIRLMNQQTFRERFYDLLDYFSSESQYRLSLYQLLTSGGFIRDLKSLAMKHQSQMNEIFGELMKNAEDLLVQGSKEGLFSIQDKESACLTLNSVILGFIFYLCNRHLFHIPLDKVKDQAYEQLLKALVS